MGGCCAPGGAGGALDDGDYTYLSVADGPNIGVSVGGAKDINNFRQCIENNTMPSNGSITYNGLLYEYYFDTSTKKTTTESKQDLENDLFYPTYRYAKVKKLDLRSSENMLQSTDTKQSEHDQEYEYYTTVGLNSNIKQHEFRRKHLNLVIVLDVSGSMNSLFHGQYTKLEAAKDAIISLCRHLTTTDRIALVIFNKTAEIKHNLELICNVNVDTLKEEILDHIKAGGGTNLEAGYKKAVELYNELIIDEEKEEDESYDNRIILLTDAQINEGETNPDLLLNVIDENSNKEQNAIYTTFIGVGLDFNGVLIEQLSNTKGCNYYCVKTMDEFRDKMTKEEFEFLVTPIAFNLCLKLKCEGNSCIIDKVYGATDRVQENIKNNGAILRIQTLFPSKRSGSRNETKGGIQLIQLKKINDERNNDIINCEIEVTFEDRKGRLYTNTQFITFDSNNDDDDNDDNFYDNDGIRKAILLCKYGELMIEWIKKNENENESNGIIIDNECLDIFQKFLVHFKNEMKEINDDTLQKEVDILQKIIDSQ